MDDAREKRPHDRHEREAFPRQDGPKLELVRDPEYVSDGKRNDQILRPAQQKGMPPIREPGNRKFPPDGRQQLQRIRVRHRPDDEDCRDAHAQEEAEQRATGGEQRDLRDRGTEARDVDWQEAE